MRERLALIREQAESLEKKVAELHAENTTLKKRVADLQAQVASKTALDDFVECRGAIFQTEADGRLSSGGILPRLSRADVLPDGRVAF